MRRFCCSCLLPLLCLAPAPALKADTTLTFERPTLSEGDVLSGQYASLGVMVSGDPVVYTAGSWLNEFDFPPHSGSNVLVDQNGPILFTFAPAGVASVSAYFTYGVPLTFELFSPGGEATTLHSADDSNLGSSDQIFFPGILGALRITGDAAGSSFTVDDVTFAASQVPEPSSLLLVLPIAAVVLRGVRKNSCR